MRRRQHPKRNTQPRVNAEGYLRRGASRYGASPRRSARYFVNGVGLGFNSAPEAGASAPCARDRRSPSASKPKLFADHNKTFQVPQKMLEAFAPNNRVVEKYFKRPQK